MSAPRWYAADDGRFRLEYELQLTNTIGVAVKVHSAAVRSGAGKLVRRLTGKKLKASLSLIGTPEEPTMALPASSVGVVWFDLTFPTRASIPNRIRHRLTVDIGPDHPELGRYLTDTTAPAMVARRDPTVLSPPLRGGRWVAIIGPHRRAINPVNGRVRIGQRFAVDFSARLDRKGSTHNGDPGVNSSYFNFGQPVLAVGAATVVAAVDGLPNQIPNDKVPVPVSETDGNHVIIRLGDGSFAAYGHLDPGSVRVRKGQRVRAGQILGKLGNSGNSGGPHLHFQLVNRPSFLDADGLPFVLDRFRLDGRVTSLEAFIEADADPAAPPVPYHRARRTARKHKGLTGLEVMTFRNRQREVPSATAARPSSFRLVRIGDGRRIYLTCRGRGKPAVILVSGFRGAYDDWTHIVPRSGGEPVTSDSSVFPQVSRFTRVCAYDRPGTVNFAGEMSPSTPVRQPTTAGDDVSDLNALLGAARVSGRYVVVAHSWGGMGTTLFASRHRARVAGLVMLDPGSVFLKQTLGPVQWTRFVRGGRKLGNPVSLEAVNYERSVKQIQGGRPVARVPSVVLTSDHPFDFGAGPGTWPAWLAAQKRLAAKLHARHIRKTDSGHYIAGERPRLVTNQIRRIVRKVRTSPRRHRDVEARKAAARINWKPCGARVQCARIRVPLDWDRPGGRKIRLAVIRHRASKPGKRIGTVFFNPGGPGSSGVEVVEDPFSAGLLDRAAGGRFDIVSWDPRGVGASTRVRCFRSEKEATRFWGKLTIPTTAPASRRYKRKVAAYARRCGEVSGNLLRHISTADTIRDLDYLRGLFGAPKLNYIGWSYGTFLGQTYANVYPKRVRAMVLDGVVDARAYVRGRESSVRNVLTPASPVFQKFLELCQRAGPRRIRSDAKTAGCALAGHGPVGKRVGQLLERVRRKPVAAPAANPPGPLTYSKLLTSIFPMLRNPGGWPDWAGDLDAAIRGDGSALANIANANPPGAGGAPAPVSIGCADSPARRSLDQWPGVMRGFTATSRIAGPVLGWWLWGPCAAWPAKSADRYTGPWNAVTGNPVLVIGTRFDPNTSYANARVTAQRLGNAVLLTHRGYGHISFVDPSRCVMAAYRSYLVRLKPPRKGAVCSSDRGPFNPDFGEPLK